MFSNRASLPLLVAGSLACGSLDSMQASGSPFAPREEAELADANANRIRSDDFADFGAGSAPRAEDSADTCVTQTIPLRQERRAIDVVLVLDNSPSMESEIEAVERNVNVNFARILDESGADYRLILLSQHRQRDRYQTEQDATAICVTQPLSGLRACPWLAPAPSARFFHYSVEINSVNSLIKILSTYDAPDEQFGTTELGWSEWLRPGSRKIFLELTDDDSTLSAERFLTRLAELDADHFGSVDEPGIVFHSIVGLHPNDPADVPYGPTDPLIGETCESPVSEVQDPGGVYQELSRRTGGLRYPLCDVSGYDAVFRSIAQDLLVRSGVACRLPLPAAPAGQSLDLARARVTYEPAGEEPGRVRLTKADQAEDCGPDGFFVREGHVELCPELCETLGRSPSTRVLLSFDCDAWVDLR